MHVCHEHAEKPALTSINQKLETRQPVILLVDDSIFIHTLFKKKLEAHNYEILHAYNGKEGYRLYQENKTSIKLVISDVQMPLMDGLELLKAIRNDESENGGNVPIISISGDG